jgi:putative transposase
MCIERNHPKVSMRRQCQMLSLARSNLYYAPKGESAENLRFMELVDKQFLETPLNQTGFTGETLVPIMLRE